MVTRTTLKEWLLDTGVYARSLRLEERIVLQYAVASMHDYPLNLQIPKSQ